MEIIIRFIGILLGSIAVGTVIKTLPYHLSGIEVIFLMIIIVIYVVRRSGDDEEF